MKKKGFTLIELIVVIAIIGVLAAILVPAMLGYIKKSKITNANAAAKSIFTASQSAITDMDAEDRSSTPVSALSNSQSLVGATPAAGSSDEVYLKKVSQYFSDLDKLSDATVALDGTTKATLGVAVHDKAGYPGSNPSQCSVDYYDDYKTGGAKANDLITFAQG